MADSIKVVRILEVVRGLCSVCGAGVDLGFLNDLLSWAGALSASSWLQRPSKADGLVR